MIIRCRKIVSEAGIVDGYIEIEGKKIVRIADQSANLKEDLDVQDNMIIPGIFDTHNHGTCGYSPMDNVTEENIRHYCKGLASQGVTSVLPTTTGFEEGYGIIADLSKTDIDGAKIIGIHSEGPYLNRVGEKGIDTGHPMPNVEQVKKMYEASKGTLKLMAIAPELEGATDVIHYLDSKGVRVSIAHTNATYEEALQSFKEGITVTTHTGNVMTGLHHRNMGTLGATLLNDEVNNELICDGLHIRNEMIEIFLRTKKDAFNKFMMISDNVCLCGFPEGRYHYFGNDLNITKEGYCLTDTGRLMGSTKPVLYGMKNLVTNLHLSIELVSRMASANPCRTYGVLDHKGTLRSGKDADFAVITPDFECVMTYSEGRKVYDREVDTNVLNTAMIEECKID